MQCLSLEVRGEKQTNFSVEGLVEEVVDEKVYAGVDDQ